MMAKGVQVQTQIMDPATESRAAEPHRPAHARGSDAALARMERESEVLIAGLRLALFLIIAGGFWWTGALDRERTAMVSVAGFGAVTAASLVPVAVGFFRPWLPWVFATLDVGVLIHCLAKFAIAMQMPASDMLNGPGAWLIFLYLAMAAVRYRLFLVLYVGILFALGWLLVWLAATSAGGAADQGAAMLEDGIPLASEIARFAVIVGTIFALAVMTWRTRRSVQTAIAEARLSATLARYFAGNVIGEVTRMAESGARLRDQNAAVLFADIRGFTGLAENMPAADVAQLLNEYRSRVAAPIARHGGTIDKFVGDGVMVVFGVPTPTPNDASNALQCALAIRKTVAAWNEERRRAGRARIEVGVGLHFGPVVAGVLGDRDRLEFTVIGDTVNVADRIQKHGPERGLSVVVSEEVLEAARQPADHEWELIGDIVVRGRNQTVTMYGLHDELNGGLPTMRRWWSRTVRSDVDVNESASG